MALFRGKTRDGGEVAFDTKTLQSVFTNVSDNGTVFIVVSLSTQQQFCLPYNPMVFDSLAKGMEED